MECNLHTACACVYMCVSRRYESGLYTLHNEGTANAFAARLRVPEYAGRAMQHTARTCMHTLLGKPCLFMCRPYACADSMCVKCDTQNTLHENVCVCVCVVWMLTGKRVADLPNDPKEQPEIVTIGKGR